MRVSLIPVCLVLAGCYQEQISEAYDRDNDGFPSHELGGPDCDDENAAVFPGAVEICGNNLDDDCSGVIDDAGTGDVIFYVDKDGDGFPGTTPSSSCTAPEGSFASLAVGADCDDSDASRSPGVPEVWYDGIDQNCDGNDTDQDGDGYEALAAGGTDCDDRARAVNPGAVEVCNNGVDDDCDGGAGPCAMVGDVDAGELVYAVTGAIGRLDVADYSGDGESDLMIHTDGRSVWMPGPVAGIVGFLTWDSGIYHFAGSPKSVASGDVNDDGLVDVVWASNSGLTLQQGPLQRESSTPESEVWLAGPPEASWYGDRVSVSQLGRGVLRQTAGPGAVQAAWVTHAPNGEGVVTGTAAVSDLNVSGVHDGLEFSGFYSWNEETITWWVAPALLERSVFLPSETVGISNVIVLGGDWPGWALIVHGTSSPQLSVVEAGLYPSDLTFVLATVSLSPGMVVTSGEFCDLTADGTEDLVVGFFEGQRDNPTRYGLLVFEGSIDQSMFGAQPVATVLDAGIETLVCADLTGDGVDDIIASDTLNGFTEVLAGRGL